MPRAVIVLIVLVAVIGGPDVLLLDQARRSADDDDRGRRRRPGQCELADCSLAAAALRSRFRRWRRIGAPATGRAAQPQPQSPAPAATTRSPAASRARLRSPPVRRVGESETGLVELLSRASCRPPPPPVEYPDHARRDPWVVGRLDPAAARAWRQSVGGSERRLPVDPDAADGDADRVALGAYRAAQRLARRGRGAAQRQPGRLGRRARLAAAAHGRSRRRADAGVGRRRRPLHAARCSRSRCRARWPTPIRRRCARCRTAFATSSSDIVPLVEAMCASLAGRAGKRRGADRLGAPPRAASAASTWCSPRRSSARAPTPAAR